MSTGVFAFRMLVCQFRREMSFDDVFGFWERLWAAEQLASSQLKVTHYACLHGRLLADNCRLKLQGSKSDESHPGVCLSLLS